MKINCTDYKTKDIIRIMRDYSDQTQEKFATTINKTRDWCAKVEGGNSNILLEDFLQLARIHNIEVIMKDKNK